MILKRIDRDEFHPMHDDAYRAVFGETPPKYEYDFAVLALNQQDQPIHFYTVNSGAKKNVAYVNFGGCFPDFRGQGQSFEIMNKVIDFLLKTHTYAQWACDSENIPMILYGAKNGFKIIGMSYVNDKLMIEHRKKRG